MICDGCNESTARTCSRHVQRYIIPDVRDGMGNPIPLRQGPDESEPTQADWQAWASVQRYLREHPLCMWPAIYDPAYTAAARRQGKETR